MEYQITKILIISFLSSILISLFLNTRYIIFFKKFSKNKKILFNLSIYSISSLTLILINYWLSLNGLTSLIVFNAAIMLPVAAWPLPVLIPVQGSLDYKEVLT